MIMRNLNIKTWELYPIVSELLLNLFVSCDQRILERIVINSDGDLTASRPRPENICAWNLERWTTQVEVTHIEKLTVFKHRKKNTKYNNLSVLTGDDSFLPLFLLVKIMDEVRRIVVRGYEYSDVTSKKFKAKGMTIKTGKIFFTMLVMRTR